ncbi:unnamed protein product [Rotaria magnacalcarata]|uniref:Uncharacterized protein n=1 Tax=Rotaria magnacalcarata TaxID=392030 RepID=A0A819J4B0_9BILA|nr:unnamed protein product [Rotaria magnacalcarata]CAF3926556.1 unnamed protein product [Rotaria magnacalcarata]
MSTPLFEACEKGDINRVKSLIEGKCHIENVNEQGRTVLHYCSDNKTIHCARLLLNDELIKEKILDLQDKEGCSALHLACMNGNQVMVKYLCEQGANVNLLDHESRSVMHWIAACGHLHLFDILLKYKAPVHTPDIRGAFPIHFASQLCGTSAGTNSTIHVDKVKLEAAHGRPKFIFIPRCTLEYGLQRCVVTLKSLAILQKFIDCKVDIDGIDEQQRTPLMWAASAGYKNKNSSLFRLEDIDVDIKNNSAVDELRLLYKYGADQLHVDKNSLSALHCAACGGHADCIRMLIEYYRCPIEGVDIRGWTPLFYSITNNHPSICQLLLDLTANPNHKDQRGRTPSHCAITDGNLDCLQVLMKSSANIWLKNKRGDYPIHEAINTISTNKSRNQIIQNEQIFAVIRYIFQLNPNKINIQNDNHRTPLHLAASLGEIETCEILIECGAKINSLIQTVADDYMTPCDLARLNHQEACANYLIYKHGGQYGAKLANIFARRIQKCYHQYKLRKTTSTIEREKLNNKPKNMLHKQKQHSCPVILTGNSNNNLLKQEKIGLDNTNEDNHLQFASVYLSTDDPLQDEDNLQERRHLFMKSKTATSMQDSDDSRMNSTNKIIIQTSNSVATYNKLYDRRKIIVEELHKLRQAKMNNNYIVINRSLYKILIENAFNPQNRGVEEIEKYLDTLISTYDSELEAIRKRTNSVSTRQSRRTSLMF